MSGLTLPQLRILQFICESVTNRGFPPSRAEIAEHCEYATPSACDVHLAALKRKGWIEITPGVSRGIKVLKPLAVHPQ